MKRIIIIGTAVAVLVGAAAAYAAFNNDAGSKLSFAPTGAGSKASPMALGMVRHLQISGPSGDRPGPLTEVKYTIYGAVTNGANFPKCTDSMIEADKTKYDKACPKGSRIGSGPVHSVLGPQSNPSSSAEAHCDLILHIYNGGQGKAVFFLTTVSATSCAGFTTGAASPYDGTISTQGKNLVMDEKLPADVSTKAANQPGLYGSTVDETLTFPRMTRKVKGKTVPYFGSVACKGHKRPWSIKLSDQTYNDGVETETVSGSSKC